MFSQRPFFLTLAMCGALALCAQNDRTKAKVVLYKDRIAAQWDTVDCVKNVLKANPLLFLRGEVPLLYERALSPRLSMEVGVGITYRNYVNLTFAGDHGDADDFGAGTRIIPSPAFHIGTRYYLVDDLEPQGAYLQLEFAYLRYAKDISVQDSLGLFSGETKLDERIFNDIRLYYGYQKLSGTSNWLFDFYGGIGLRSRYMEVVSEKLNLAEGKRSYTVETIEDVVPALFLGVKVGLGW